MLRSNRTNLTFVQGWAGRLGFCVALLLGGAARAGQFDIVGPAGSVAFGTAVAVLPNGNIVVTDPTGPVSGVGAVYLYSPTGSLISTLTGSTANDHVGSGGVVVLSNGNYVILSPDWNEVGASRAGAVTWGSASLGVAGVVSSANSLVGSSTDDHLGYSVSASLTVLSNGNYVVTSPDWDNAGASDAGAATWGNGNSGVSGTITATNSLIGNANNDRIGARGARALTNGNYVVGSPGWNGGRGAATFGNGSVGVSGSVSAANSLVGEINDLVAQTVMPLSNGNYIVLSQYWANAGLGQAGAVTWCNGTTGRIGAVTAGNSLVGTKPSDNVGWSASVLSNGNYVVRSPYWNNALFDDVGAASWGNGASGTTGPVSASNSLIGTTQSDLVGLNVVPLTNGNYVVGSSVWHNAALSSAGAATWGNGLSGTSGVVSASNSLIGTHEYDAVGSGLRALSNGHYVLYTNGWDNGSALNAGAVTWGNGNVGTTGSVSAANSLVGSSTDDQIGSHSGASVLSNGHYVVSSPYWDNGGIADAGAVTWANGSGGSVGPINTINSLVGTAQDDEIGFGGVTALSNGHYVVASENWNYIGNVDSGAVTWGNGNTGIVGAVSSFNSLYGPFVGDKVGRFGATALSNGNYVVRSSYFDSMALGYVGAVTLVRGFSPTASSYAQIENVHGGVNILAASGFDYDATRDQLIVGRPFANRVTVLRLDLLFRNGFD